MLNMLNCAVQCQWTTHTHTHTLITDSFELFSSLRAFFLLFVGFVQPLITDSFELFSSLRAFFLLFVGFVQPLITDSFELFSSLRAFFLLFVGFVQPLITDSFKFKPARWLTYVQFRCEVDVHWFNKLFWPIRTGHKLQPENGLKYANVNEQ